MKLGQSVSVRDAVDVVEQKPKADSGKPMEAVLFGSPLSALRFDQP
jgi:hypothetical protein